MECVFSDFPLATDIYKSKRKFQMREILTRPSSVMPIDKLSDIEIILKKRVFQNLLYEELYDSRRINRVYTLLNFSTKR